MYRVVMTGAMGFVGRQVLTAALERNWSVTVQKPPQEVARFIHGFSKAGESCRRNWHATPSSTESRAIGAELFLRTQPILRILASASVASVLAVDILWQLLARGITLRIRDDE